MTTINVKDSDGNVVAIEKPLAPSRAAAASSRPVALSTEDKAAIDLLHTDLSSGMTLSGTIGIAAGTSHIGSVTPEFTSGGNVSLQSNATGTTYNAFSSQACKQLTIINDTGVDVELRQAGAGVAIPVFNGTVYTFYGIVNASDLGYRRVDNSNTQVTLKARWES